MAQGIGSIRQHRPHLSISIVAYRTPAEDLDRLLVELQAGHESASIAVFDNSPSQDLRRTVEGRGALYLSAGRNIGFGAGHNLAMQSVIDSSTYHLVCNPDISLGPHVLGELADFMERFPEVGHVMPRILYPDGDEQRLCKLLPSPADLLVRRFLGRMGGKKTRSRQECYELRHLDMESPREVPSLSGCFMFLRTSVLRQTGLFDPRFFLYMEDVDLCRRIGSAARTVFYPFVSVTHAYAKGSYRNLKLLQYHIASAIRYFNKWGWLVDQERQELNTRLSLWSEISAGRRSAAAFEQHHGPGVAMQHQS
jgi:GT2 family glycosyltransferase